MCSDCASVKFDNSSKKKKKTHFDQMATIVAISG